MMRVSFHDCDECYERALCVAVGGRNDVRGDSSTYLCGACLEMLSDEVGEAERKNQARKDRNRADGTDE